MEVDVLIVGDFRFPGGTSSSIVSDIRAMTAAGYSVGLISLATAPLATTMPLHNDITALASEPGVTCVPQGVAVRAALCCLHHPAVFERLPAVPLLIDCPKFLMIVHHPPVDAFGDSQYDIARIMAITSDLFGPVDWAPVGPKVRAGFAGLSPLPALTRDDWYNVIDADNTCSGPARLPGTPPVIGRHSRPQAIKWPDDPTTFLQAYPDDPRVQVRLMGYGSAQDEIVETRPANWTVLPFNALPVADFLGSIDYFSYFCSEEWVEAFGRSILEAMAAGIICFLPPDFADLFEDGALYCAPADVLDHVLALEAAPQDYAAQSRRAMALVRRKFSPAQRAAQIRALIGAPQKYPVAPRRQTVILYLTSNGIGMGHITRCMASARRLGPDFKPMIVTMSKAFGVAREHGIDVEYIPYFRSVDLSYQVWTTKLKAELAQIIHYHNPAVLVFDGNVPYTGLHDSLRAFRDIWHVWQRRPLWRPETGQRYLDLSHHFDAVLEPGERADPVDRGLTRSQQNRAFCVPPITLLDTDEMLERNAARAILGLDPARPAIVLQLGSGNNFDTGATLRDICALTDPVHVKSPPQIVLMRWKISTDAPELPAHVKTFDTFPIARFLNAFDGAVALAGYNTFHENITARLPTLFTANDHPEQDEQWLRAQYAAQCGLALTARPRDPFDLRRKFRQLLDRDVQERLRSACETAHLVNGAHQTARFLEGLAMTRKPSHLSFHIPHRTPA